LQQRSKVNRMSRTYRENIAKATTKKRRKTKKNKYAWKIFREEDMSLSSNQNSYKEAIE